MCELICWFSSSCSIVLYEPYLTLYYTGGGQCVEQKRGGTKRCQIPHLLQGRRDGVNEDEQWWGGWARWLPGDMCGCCFRQERWLHIDLVYRRGKRSANGRNWFSLTLNAEEGRGKCITKMMLQQLKMKNSTVKVKNKLSTSCRDQKHFLCLGIVSNEPSL